MAMNGLSNINFGPAFGGFSAAEANNEELANLKMKRLQDMFEANQIAANTEYRDLESDLFRQKMPNEVAVSNLAGSRANVMNTTEMNTAYGAGQLGGFKEAEAKGAKAERTLESDVASTNSSNQAAINQQAQLSSIATLQRGLIAAQQQGPLAGKTWDQLLSTLPDTPFNDSLRKQLVGNYQSAAKVLPLMQSAVMAADPKFVKDKLVEDQKQVNRVTIAEMEQGRADRRAALTENNYADRSLETQLRMATSDRNNIRNVLSKQLIDARGEGGFLYEPRLRGEILKANPNLSPKEVTSQVNAAIKARIAQATKQFDKQLVDADREVKHINTLLRTPRDKRGKVAEEYNKSSPKTQEEIDAAFNAIAGETAPPAVPPNKPAVTVDQWTARPSAPARFEGNLSIPVPVPTRITNAI